MGYIPTIIFPLPLIYFTPLPAVFRIPRILQVVADVNKTIRGLMHPKLDVATGAQQSGFLLVDEHERAIVLDAALCKQCPAVTSVPKVNTNWKIWDTLPTEIPRFYVRRDSTWARSLQQWGTTQCHQCATQPSPMMRFRSLHFVPRLHRAVHCSQCNDLPVCTRSARSTAVATLHPGAGTAIVSSPGLRGVVVSDQRAYLCRAGRRYVMQR